MNFFFFILILKNYIMSLEDEMTSNSFPFTDDNTMRKKKKLAYESASVFLLLPYLFDVDAFDNGRTTSIQN